MSYRNGNIVGGISQTLASESMLKNYAIVKSYWYLKFVFRFDHVQMSSMCILYVKTIYVDGHWLSIYNFTVYYVQEGLLFFRRFMDLFYFRDMVVAAKNVLFMIILSFLDGSLMKTSLELLTLSIVMILGLLVLNFKVYFFFYYVD